MRALTYHGSGDVRVDNVPEPELQESDDILLRVTATAICGSDLHLYRGKIPMVDQGDILGHEFMGIVEEVGRDVTAVCPGDRVVIPFVIACGSCFFCQHELFAACETTNTGRGAIINKKSIPPGAALFGYSHLYGGIPGGQADYVRVPKANTGPFKVPGHLEWPRIGLGHPHVIGLTAGNAAIQVAIAEKRSARRDALLVDDRPAPRIGSLAGGEQFVLAEETAATGNHEWNHHAITGADGGDVTPHLLDDPHEFVTENIALVDHGDLAAIQVQIRATDRCSGHP